MLCPIAQPINGLILNPVPYPLGNAARFYLLNAKYSTSENILSS